MPRQRAQGRKDSGKVDTSHQLHKKTTQRKPATNAQVRQNDEARHIEVWYDGGSRDNPGCAGAGSLVYLVVGSRKQLVRRRAIFIGLKETNNEAEYSGRCSGVDVRNRSESPRSSDRGLQTISEVSGRSEVTT